MYKLLSYVLNERTPSYGDSSHLSIRYDRKMAENDSCNTATISLSNHLGTHIDAPKHFDQNGRAIASYSIDELIFDKPQIIDCPKKENEFVKKEDLNSMSDCNLLLIRTGFYKLRSDKRYCLNNPAISAEAAEYLRKEHPHIKAIGIDSLSVAPFQSREEGRKTHRILLNDKGYSGQPMLLIEDMDLSFSESKLVKVYVAPLFVEGVDSMPCTVIGEFE